MELRNVVWACALSRIFLSWLECLIPYLWLECRNDGDKNVRRRMDTDAAYSPTLR
jgi:hypothetical protein